jgi:predicted house-cleaning NTP pyrophosphatase (Maf/HAM1 superfamily)
MSRARTIMLGLLGVFALSAIAAPIASASEGPEWWVGKSLLKGSEPIAENTKVPTPFKLEAHGEKVSPFVIECSELKVVGGAIESPNKRKEEALTFGKCIVVGQTGCTVATAKSKPLEAVLEGAVGAIKLKFKPQSGKEIATYVISGSPCTVDGSYQADGTMICSYEKVETESEEHPLEFLSGGSKVEIGGVNANFTGKDEVHLSSKKLWSAQF